jgi:hypothetical protein
MWGWITLPLNRPQWPAILSPPLRAQARAIGL